MNRLYILLTIVVVMVGALCATHEALAKVLTGTSGDDMLLGTDGDDRLDGRGGDDEIEGGGGDRKGGGGTTRWKAAPATTRSSPVKATTRWTLALAIYARDTDGVDYIDCGGGFDKEWNHAGRQNQEQRCERSLGPRQGDI